MRVLLDECIDERLRHHITGHGCRTCRYAGFRGLTSGKPLLQWTRNMRYQQRLSERKIAPVIMDGRTTNLDDLVQFVPDVLSALAVVKPGDVICVGNR